jgi:PKD repeat protein
MKSFRICLTLMLLGSFVYGTTIYDIQYTTEAGDNNYYPSPMLDMEVTVTGIVTGANYNNDNKFFMSDPEGGAWSGIYVYEYETGPALGDLVQVTGTVIEYYGLTEISYCTVDIISSGNTVPEPITVSTIEVVTPALAEPYEGCLIQIDNVVVTEVQDDYGQWYIDDGSGECQVDDGFFYLDAVTPEIVIEEGMEWDRIIGCVDYGYGEYSVNPRTQEDLIYELSPFSADFTADPVSGVAPLEVQFTDISTTDVNPIVSWEWDFENDGIIDSYLQSPTHIYSETGLYSVSLTISDGDNNSIVLKTDYIDVGGSLVNAVMEASPVIGIVPLDVQFTDLSVTYQDPIINREWDFDNNGVVDSYLQHPEFTYTEVGLFSVSLTVSDGINEDTVVMTDYIEIQESVVTASFNADNDTGVLPLNIQFNDLSYTNQNPIISWEWDFDNDGIIDSELENPSYEYTLAGSYTVSLTVSDGYSEDTLIQEDYITVLDVLEADFVADITNGDAPLEVSFSNLSTGQIIGWMWDFDNNGSIDSNDQNPTHIYQMPGIYSVSLTVTDGSFEQTELKTDYIEVTGTEVNEFDIPKITCLIGNYPNPFNPETTINYSVKTAAHVNITVYNTKGQEVATLVNETVSAGNNSVVWNADVSSGMYFYKLTTSEGSQTKKMVLLK